MGVVVLTGVTLAASGSASASVVSRPRLVVLGDSVPAASACDCSGFGSELAAAGSAAMTNAARPGLTSSGLLAQLKQPALVAALRRATLVTVTIGANDFDQARANDPSCVDLHCYAATLRQLTAVMRAVATRIHTSTPPGSTVVFTGYWNVFADGAVGAQHGATYVAVSDALTRQVNGALRQVAFQAHALYADLYTPFNGDGSDDDTALLAADGDHPNAAGHHLIAKVIASTARVVRPH